MLVGILIGKGRDLLKFKNIFSDDVNILQKKIGCYEILLAVHKKSQAKEIEDGYEYKMYQHNYNNRNIGFILNNEKITIKTDWLGSVPIFYNEITKEISTHWFLVDDINNPKDYEGTYYIKKYSYIPTDITTKKNIRRLLGGSQLSWPNLEVKSNIINKIQTNTENISLLVKKEIERFNDKKFEKVCIPLSGGYDSRFLLNTAKELDIELSALTYTLNYKEGLCFESKVSKVVAEKLNVPWKYYSLKGYKIFENNIYNWIGGYSHINGDYYEKFVDVLIKDDYFKNKNTFVLSGIVGDAWSGKIQVQINRDSVLYSHGIKLYKWLFNEEELKRMKIAEDRLENFYLNKLNSKDDVLIELVKSKLPMLSFLCYSFEKKGINVCTPFLKKEIVLSILSLDENERKHRRWQNKIFSKASISNSDLPKVFFKNNTLAIKEGSKSTYCNDKNDLNRFQKIILKIILHKKYRVIETLFISNKFFEYILRKCGYIRSDILISILKVTE